MSMIVEMKLGKLARRLAANQKVQLTFADDVIASITSACTRAETGARNIDAIVDRTLGPDISAQLLGFMAEGESPQTLHISKGENGQYLYEFN
jgi:type VI secretion system protein VasG